MAYKRHTFGPFVISSLPACPQQVWTHEYKNIDKILLKTNLYAYVIGFKQQESRSNMRWCSMAQLEQEHESRIVGNIGCFSLCSTISLNFIHFFMYVSSSG